MNARYAVFAALAVSLLTACTEKTPASHKLDERSAQVGIMAVQWPKVVLANTDFTVKAVVHNASGDSIPSQAASKSGALRVNATYHWRSTDYKVVVWDGILTPLASDLLPGTDEDVDVNVRAPSSPGTYILELDLVQATAFWFGGVGSQTATMLVQVR